MAAAAAAAAAANEDIGADVTGRCSAAAADVVPDFDAEFSAHVWSYLCHEWNSRHSPEERVLRYNFFMLQVIRRVTEVYGAGK